MLGAPDVATNVTTWASGEGQVHSPWSGASCWKGLLVKDKKSVCDIQSHSAPLKLPPKLPISGFDSASFYPLLVLPQFEICPLGANPARLEEWRRFTSYLMNHNKVAILMLNDWELLINPPSGHTVGPKQSVFVSYRKKVTLSPTSYVLPISCDAQREQPFKLSQPQLETGQNRSFNELSRFAKTHPSYTETLGQMHASWIFGAIAELVDNARDAGATRLGKEVMFIVCSLLLHTTK